MNSIRYVALLRGINVGGHKIVKMEDVRRAFESLGFTDVRTIRASGNVLFETKKTDPHHLVEKIEETLQKTFGHRIGTIVRTIDALRQLVDADPFHRINVTPDTRLYVMFLSEKSNSSLKIPYVSPEKDFSILRVADGAVCSVLTLSPTRGTTDSMKILEKEYGKSVTTRNWNTVQKIINLST